MIVKNTETGATHEIPPGSRAERRIKGNPLYEEVKPEPDKPKAKPEKSG
jgi:hypothetical protein